MQILDDSSGKKKEPHISIYGYRDGESFQDTGIYANFCKAVVSAFILLVLFLCNQMFVDQFLNLCRFRIDINGFVI